MAQAEKQEKEAVVEKKYVWLVSADVKLTSKEAGVVQALLNAGVTKTAIVQKSLDLFLSKKPDEILELVGLKQALENPELVPLSSYEFREIKK